jgi:hypothetical protein
LAGDYAQPSKRARASSLKNMLVPKYVIILIVYSTLNFDQHSDIMVVHRKSSVSAQPKPTSAQVTTPKTATPAAATSSSVGGTVWTILSIADAWDSSRRVTEFLENLKNREVDREGILFTPLDASIH